MDNADLPDIERGVLADLHKVASVFADAQQRRNEADYNTGKICTRTQVSLQVDEVAAAFSCWGRIRSEPAAQAYLLSVLAKKR